MIKSKNVPKKPKNDAFIFTTIFAIYFQHNIVIKIFREGFNFGRSVLIPVGSLRVRPCSVYVFATVTICVWLILIWKVQIRSGDFDKILEDGRTISTSIRVSFIRIQCSHTLINMVKLIVVIGTLNVLRLHDIYTCLQQANC